MHARERRCLASSALPARAASLRQRRHQRRPLRSQATRQGHMLPFEVIVDKQNVEERMALVRKKQDLVKWIL